MPVDDPKTCIEISRLHDSITTMSAKFDAFTISFHQHAIKEMKIEEDIQKVLDAFPDGPERHRDAHQAMIDAAKAQEQFYNDLRKDIVRWGVFGFITVVMGIFLLGLKAHVSGWLGMK